MDCVAASSQNSIGINSFNEDKNPHFDGYVGCSDFVAIQSKHKESQQNMSLVYVLHNNNELYLAADSRSTNKEKTYIHNDDYKKIALFKPTNKIIASTGDNDFNGKNLTALVNECKSEDELKEKLLSYETSLYIFSVEYGKIYMEIIMFHNKTYSVTKNCVSGRKETASFLSSSSVTNFLKSILVSDKYNDKTALAYINAIYGLCMSVPKISDDTIGGDIHIMKITPDGFTWLQNGYEL